MYIIQTYVSRNNEIIRIRGFKQWVGATLIPGDAVQLDVLIDDEHQFVRSYHIDIMSLCEGAYVPLHDSGKTVVVQYIPGYIPRDIVESITIPAMVVLATEE